MLTIFIAAFAIAYAVSLSLRVADSLWRPVRAVVRFACRIGILTFGIGAFVFVSEGLDERAWSVVAAGTVFSALAIALLVRYFRSRPVRSELLRWSRTDIAQKPIVQTNARPEKQLLWSQLLANGSWNQRSRIRSARASIEAFESELASHTDLHEHLSLSVAVEKRVPELLRECLARCSCATRQERAIYVEKTTAVLAQLANEAERARFRMRADGDRKLDILHRYFADRTVDKHPI